MVDSTIGTKLTNIHKSVYLKSSIDSDDTEENNASDITKLDNPQPSIYVKNPTIVPVYSQRDSSTIIGTSITQGGVTTVDYDSGISIFDKYSSTTLIYVAGGALILILILF